MSVKEYPSVEFIRQCFRYEDGKLFWLFRPREHFPTYRAWRIWNGKYSGKEAGWVQTHADMNRRQVAVGLGSTRVYRSILVWAVINGNWPANEIDHRDRNPLNDSIGNLREADRFQQSGNRGKPKHNTTGYKGVGWIHRNGKRDGMYRARIAVKGKVIHLGCFTDPEEAHRAYREASIKYYKEFACDGQ